MTVRQRIRLHARLGRVSNLPTVCSNVLAGAVLGGGTTHPAVLVLLTIAMCSFYVGGMYLNDAFDRKIDAIERPERPIPSHLIDARRVFAIGFAALGAGIGILAGLRLVGHGHAGTMASALALAFVIVVYDVWHKGNPFGPFLMATCRVLVYVTAALATGARTPGPVIVGSVILFGYLSALTYVAKHERRLLPRTVPRGAVIGWLIAGISLVDAVLVAVSGRPGVALLCVAAGALTLVSQRAVAGT
ncbi:MAG: UbiA family prenyltransferase [Polyangiaceae bacterium]|nr:UbiA family prenyltransferase [Polyangiaceae bacterium]